MGKNRYVVDLTDAEDDALLVRETIEGDSYAFERDCLTFYAGGLGAVASFAAERVLGVRLVGDMPTKPTSEI
jgi:hypothetical protein